MYRSNIHSPSHRHQQGQQPLPHSSAPAQCCYEAQIRNTLWLGENLHTLQLPAQTSLKQRLVRTLTNRDTFRLLTTSDQLRTLNCIFLYGTETKDKSILTSFIQHMSPADFAAIYQNRRDDLPLQCWALWVNAATILFHHSAPVLMAKLSHYREHARQNITPGDALAKADHRTRCRSIFLYRSCHRFTEGLEEISQLRQWLDTHTATDVYKDNLRLELKQEEALLRLELQNPHLARLCLQEAVQLEKKLGAQSSVIPALEAKVILCETRITGPSDEERAQKLKQALRLLQPHISSYEGARTTAARIQMDMNHYEEALKLLTESGDQNEFRQRLTAICLNKLGRYEEAYLILGPLIENNQGFCKLWNETAITCQDWSKNLQPGDKRNPKDLLERSLKYALKGLICDEGFASGWSCLGHILKDMQDAHMNWQDIHQQLPEELKANSSSFTEAASAAFRKADALNPARLGSSISSSMNASFRAQKL